MRSHVLRNEQHPVSTLLPIATNRQWEMLQVQDSLHPPEAISLGADKDVGKQASRDSGDSMSKGPGHNVVLLFRGRAGEGGSTGM